LRTAGLLVVALAFGSPASAGMLRSLSLEVAVQGYGSAVPQPWSLGPPSGSFAGTVVGGRPVGQLYAYGNFEPFVGPSLTDPTAPISRIHFTFYNAAAGGNPTRIGAGVEAAITWFAGGNQVARNEAPDFIGHRAQQILTGPGVTITFAPGHFTLGRVSATGLTLGGAPHPTSPTLSETGSAEVTPAGDVHIQLVSLGRIRVRGIEISTRAIANRLTLVFAPEPQAALLIAGAALALLAARGRSSSD